MSGWCQLWNHFSLDWAILSSESLCSVRLSCLQPVIVSSTSSASPGASCQKREPLRHRRVISYQNSRSPGIAKRCFSTQPQTHPSSCLTGAAVSQSTGRQSTPSRQSPQDARLPFLPERTTKRLGLNKGFPDSPVRCEQPSWNKSPTKNRVKWNRENSAQDEVPLVKGKAQIKESRMNTCLPRPLAADISVHAQQQIWEIIRSAVWA